MIGGYTISIAIHIGMYWYLQVIIGLHTYIWVCCVACMCVPVCAIYQKKMDKPLLVWILWLIGVYKALDTQTQGSEYRGNRAESNWTLNGWWNHKTIHKSQVMELAREMKNWKSLQRTTISKTIDYPVEICSAVEF